MRAATAWILSVAMAAIWLLWPSLVEWRAMGLLALLPLCAALALNAERRARWGLPLLLVAAAGLSVILHWQERRPDRMAGLASAEARTVVGRVLDLPTFEQESARLSVHRFSLELEALDGRALAAPVRLRVSAWNVPWRVQAGERWQMQLRIKPARGSVNPAGFDYERWLYAQHIEGMASALAPGAARLSAAYPLDPQHWRQQLYLRLQALPLQHKELLAGLAFAADGGISPDSWQAFRLTGTTHLIAVSGLHIVLVAGLLRWLSAWIWRRSARACGWLPAPTFADAAALLAALMYVLLAGLALPAVRAGLMLAAVLLPRLFRWRLSPASGLSLAMLGLLIADPCVLLEPGYWLSGGAVALIFLSQWGRIRNRNRSAGLSHLIDGLRLQAVVSFGMLPLTGFWFGEWAWISPLVNLPAVPWVSWLSTPLALLGCLLLPLGETWALPMLQLADWSLHPFVEGTAWLAAGVAQVTASSLPGALSLVVLGVAFLVWLAPLPFARVAAVLTVLLTGLALLRQVDTPPSMTVLDVGQGLAVVIQGEQGERLVYDLGPQSARFAAGQQIVTPWLQASKGKPPALLVLSHDDADHVGGATVFDAYWRPSQVWAGERGVLPAAKPCRAGDRLELGGLQIEVLWPAAGRRLQGNAASCVLRVQYGATRVLLTGDIGKREEQAMLKAGADVRADWLIAAHHGSRYSSSPAFLDAVQPRDVVFSAGYRNRHQHPHPVVLAAARARGARIWNTAETGALQVQFANGRHQPETVQPARCRPQLWRRPADAC